MAGSTGDIPAGLWEVKELLGIWMSGLSPQLEWEVEGQTKEVEEAESIEAAKRMAVIRFICLGLAWCLFALVLIESQYSIGPVRHGNAN